MNGSDAIGTAAMSGVRGCAAGIGLLLLAGCAADRTGGEGPVGEGSGTVSAASSDVNPELARLRSAVTWPGGNAARGKGLYGGLCGRCHRLHGEGGDVGPDLTPYNRTTESLDFLLHVIVEPESETRVDESHRLYEVTTKDGRVRQGALVEEGRGYIALAEVTGLRTVIPDEQIEGSRRIIGTLMPAGMLRGMNDSELRDLFAYLMSDGR